MLVEKLNFPGGDVTSQSLVMTKSITLFRERRLTC